jgi:hypothetical protein
VRSLTPLDIYRRYRNTMARITVVNGDGDLLSGAGFHVGSGYLLTARHVVENLHIQEIVPESGFGEPLDIESVILSREPNIDLALVKTNFNRVRLFDKSQVVPIGMHFDDMVDDELTMTNVIVMGYPRVLFASGMPLVTVSGQISAVLDRYDVHRMHFVVSTMARGGFSGGPVISEYDFLLGVATESLLVHESIPETGFSAVLSTEGLWHILIDNHLLPAGVNGESVLEYLPYELADWSEAERTLPPDDA